jgi:glycosyltransferase involved in cell wall biosynthesis
MRRWQRRECLLSYAARRLKNSNDKQWMQSSRRNSWESNVSEPLVSVCIRNFNYEKYVSHAIESALAQTYRHIEVIVVDDGSTDRSRDVIASFGDQIRSEFQENQGNLAAGNKCFALARGEIIIYLDSDDLLYPSAVAEVVRAWTSDTAKVQFQLAAIDGGGHLKDGSSFPTYPPKYGPEEIRREFLATGNYSWPVTTGNSYARGFLEKILPFPRCQTIDGALNTIAPLFGEVRTIARTLGCYRVHDTNIWARSSGAPYRFAEYIVQKHKEMAFLRKYAADAGVALPEGNLLDCLPYFLDCRLCALKLHQDYPGREEDSSARLGLLAVKHIFRSDARVLHRLFRFVWSVALAMSWGAVAHKLIALRYEDPSTRPQVIKWAWKSLRPHKQSLRKQ